MYLRYVKREGQWPCKNAAEFRNRKKLTQLWEVGGPRHDTTCNETFTVLQNGEMGGRSSFGGRVKTTFLCRTGPYEGDIGHRGAPRPCKMGDTGRDGPKSTTPAKLDWHLG